MPGSRILLAAAFLLLLFGTLARGAEIKLYLKDGNYHIVREDEIRGSRVRFYSLERSEWEELPRALVDLEATEKKKSRSARKIFRTPSSWRASDLPSSRAGALRSSPA